nr:uncharacterized protein LOC107446895 [Parasteatoda tepidariorum]
MLLKHAVLARPVFLPMLKIITRTNFNRTKHSESFLNDKKTIKINDILSSFGFNYGQVAYILKSPHLILSYGKEDLMSNILRWQMLQVDKKKLCTALTRCPELLTLNPAYIDSRIKELMTIFTQKDIDKLLVTCPEIFLDDFDDIKEKVEYIVYFMGVEQSSIVKTEAMQFDLDYIKIRHDFMLRTGFYRMKKRVVQAKTAPLNKIFSRNVQTFLKLSGLSKEEFDAFRNAYKFEQQQKQLDEEDSDEDV